MNHYLEAGKITNTHGIHGDLKIEFWCDSYAVFHSLPELYLSDETDQYARYAITKNSPYKGEALVHLSGIDDIETAQTLKGRKVYALRAHLPLADDRIFIADILSLPVIDADSRTQYGILQDVVENGSAQLYEIALPNGKTAYMPAIKEFIDHIDLQAGIYITPPEGLFS